MLGDVLLAADITFPDARGHGDRKAVLVIRQSLDDDSKEAMVGEHGVGMIHLTWRPYEAATMQDAQFRLGGILNGIKAKRIGIGRSERCSLRSYRATRQMPLAGKHLYPY